MDKKHILYNPYTESISWWSQGKGPNIVYPDGTVFYTNKNGYIHRTTGPARILPTGRREYWVTGKELTSEEFFITYGVL